MPFLQIDFCVGEEVPCMQVACTTFKVVRIPGKAYLQLGREIESILGGMRRELCNAAYVVLRNPIWIECEFQLRITILNRHCSSRRLRRTAPRPLKARLLRLSAQAPLRLSRAIRSPRVREVPTQPILAEQQKRSRRLTTNIASRSRRKPNN